MPDATEMPIVPGAAFGITPPLTPPHEGEGDRAALALVRV